MSRRTIAYVVILAVLFALTLVRQLTDTGPAPIAYRLPEVSAEAATKIVLTADGEAVVMERTGEMWMLTSPLSWPADQSAVSGVLRAFEKPISMDFLVTEDPEEQGGYELTEAQALKVEIFTGDELPEVALYLGKNGPMGTNFLRPVGSAEVYRAKVGSVSRFKKAAADWRDKRVLLLEQDDITALTVEHPDGERIEVAKEGDEWTSRTPAGMKLDRSRVDSMARAFANLRASEILDSDVDQTHFANPNLVVTATLSGGQTQSITVGAVKEEGARYVGRSIDSQRFVVRDSSLTNLRRTAADLRDKTLLSFKAEDVSRIAASAGEDKVVIEADDPPNNWRLIEGTPGEANAQTMNGILSSLGSLRAVSFHEERDVASAGFDDGLTIEVTLKEGASHTLQLGAEADGGEVFARVDDGPVVTIRSYVSQNVRKLLPAS